ncbi:hypothetical protein Syun_007665 [Stephania yunnanensis]|uniref:Ribosomal protein L34e superfamily protein n=1 Tax=Stephania yunnanensis TaxID=152371 RepID=A0AAP0L2M5_9MAGN
MPHLPTTTALKNASPTSGGGGGGGGSGKTSHCKHKHSPSATLDLLILILVLFSCAFLITSSLSSLFHSLSLLLLPHLPLPLPLSLPSLAAALLALSLCFCFCFCCGCCGFCGGGRRSRPRRCGNPKCKGLKKALEFDIQVQTEECLRGSGGREIDELPWKGGTEGNPDYECFRAELRKMAPPCGRAVLLFRARCGCPVAKLEAWGNKRGKKHNKALSVLDGGGTHR